MQLPARGSTIAIVATSVTSRAIPLRIAALPIGIAYGASGTGAFCAEIEHLVLEEDDRVVVANRCWSAAPSRRKAIRGREHDQPGHMGEPGLEALRVLRGQPDAAALRSAHTSGTVGLPPSM